MRNLIRGLIPALVLAVLPLTAGAGVMVGVSVNIAPPALPVYVQPEIPAPGYIWTPGYWAWAPEGYYWVPGTWVLPPAVGLLWTPGYWGWGDGAYLWHVGYWGHHVGFYGGVNYGCGYRGVGYEGGYWRGDRFFYNRAVNNVRTINVTNVYTRPVMAGPANRASFNGGAGGIAARPSAGELSAARERHVGFTNLQREHENLARGDNALHASVNGGHPAIAATQRPGVFTGRGVVASRGAPNPAAQNHSDRPPQALQAQHTAASPQPYSRGPAPQGSPAHARANAPGAYPRAGSAEGSQPAAAERAHSAGAPQSAYRAPAPQAARPPAWQAAHTAAPQATYPHGSPAPQGSRPPAWQGRPAAAPQAAYPHGASAPQAARPAAPQGGNPRTAGGPGGANRPEGHEGQGRR